MLTKKEALVLSRERVKLQRTLGGIREMTRTPSAIWIVDTNKEHLAVDEARKLGIPVVAILDTNCDPDVVDYKIPGNDDAIRSIQVLTRVIADAVAEGLMARAGACRRRRQARLAGRRRAAARVGDGAADRRRPPRSPAPPTARPSTAPAGPSPSPVPPARPPPP